MWTTRRCLFVNVVHCERLGFRAQLWAPTQINIIYLMRNLVETFSSVSKHPPWPLRPSTPWTRKHSSLDIGSDLQPTSHLYILSSGYKCSTPTPYLPSSNTKLYCTNTYIQHQFHKKPMYFVLALNVSRRNALFISG
jgi:hypothetical protein